MLNIYCFKWGSKYGPEYVNRLYRALTIHCKTEFTFTCITDNINGIRSEVEIECIRSYEKRSNLFTIQKLHLMARKKQGKNLLLDLDILIHNDITDLALTESKKPTFIWTDWTPDWHWDILVPKKTACFVNSSFVRWDNDQAFFLYEYYLDDMIRIESEYNSLDKYLFYEHHIPSKALDFWPPGRFYNYNEQGPNQRKYNPAASCCLFNTSHLVKMGRTCYELSETPDWAADIWESYDE